MNKTFEQIKQEILDKKKNGKRKKEFNITKQEGKIILTAIK